MNTNTLIIVALLVVGAIFVAKELKPAPPPPNYFGDALKALPSILGAL